MRILHLVKTATGGRWALLLVQALCSMGHDIHVILSEDGPMAAKYELAGATVYIIPIDIASIKPFHLFLSVKKFRRLVLKLKPALIHSHFVGTTLFMRLALLRCRWRCPRIFQVPGPLHLENLPSRLVELWSARANDFWIATCKYTYEKYLLLGVSSHRIYLSYYGTDVESIHRRGLREVAKRMLPVSSSAIVVGMVAYMYPPRAWLGQAVGLKGHEDLIAALALLVEEGLDVVGVFVGGAWNGATWYEKKVRDYGKKMLGSRAIFLGNRSDVPLLYEAFDVAVHPSHSENVGGAVESLLMEVPTVASCVGGFPDVIVDGKTGWLVLPRRPRALASAIANVANNFERSSAMARGGRALCLDLFDIGRTSLEIARIYDSVLSAANP